MSDCEFLVIQERTLEAFERAINQKLDESRWRILKLETSIPDAWFNAYLVRESQTK